MNCPYCQDNMTESKVESGVFYCWNCLIIVVEDEEDGSRTIHLPETIHLTKELA